MQIEIATKNDAKSILELQKIAFHQRGLDYNNMNLKPLVETLGEYTESFPKYKCLKAIINDVLVGSVRANQLNETCYISRLIVHPEYQGKGIGSKLVLEIERYFRKTASRFELFTGETNQKSLSIYKNLGYSVFGRSDDYEVPIVYLEKNRIALDDISICIADIHQIAHHSAIKSLVNEYFIWGNSISIEKHGYHFDVDTMFADFLNELPKYKYPDGILNLLVHKGKYFGIGGFKRIDENSCEIKRMYIQENYRGNNLGELLLRTLINTAEDYGYKEMRLESARFMINAHALYNANGFIEIDIYKDVESPEEYQSIIYCMKKQLNPKKKMGEDAREEIDDN